MDEKFMLMAIQEAKKASRQGEVPVGAVIVKDGVVLAKAFNTKEHDNVVTGHAEILAIKEASSKLNNWRLSDCDIYVTLEPCPMCASAIKQSRISHLYYGLSNKDKNNNKIINLIFEKDSSNPEVIVHCGYFIPEIQKLMSDFFQTRR